VIGIRFVFVNVFGSIGGQFVTEISKIVDKSTMVFCAKPICENKANRNERKMDREQSPMLPMTVPRQLSVSSHMQQIVLTMLFFRWAALAKHMQ